MCNCFADVDSRIKVVMVLSECSVVICTGVGRTHHMSLRVSSGSDREPVTVDVHSDSCRTSDRSTDICSTSTHEKLHNLTLVCWPLALLLFLFIMNVHTAELLNACYDC